MLNYRFVRKNLCRIIRQRALMPVALVLAAIVPACVCAHDCVFADPQTGQFFVIYDDARPSTIEAINTRLTQAKDRARRLWGDRFVYWSFDGTGYQSVVRLGKDRFGHYGFAFGFDERSPRQADQNAMSQAKDAGATQAEIVKRYYTHGNGQGSGSGAEMKEK